MRRLAEQRAKGAEKRMIFTGSKKAAKAAIGIAMTESREEEKLSSPMRGRRH